MGQFRLYFILSLVISHWLLAEVRYVSHSGSSTPPYLTWETAADSIMFAINVSSFGDTIYVANGVYEEQVVMITGLSLIGAGMDSCVIDTRTLVNAQEFISVEVKDSCLLKGFHIVVYNNTEMGVGIGGAGGNTSLAMLNKVSDANIGVFLDATWLGIADMTTYKNICDNVHIGIYLFNSNSLVRGNTIYTDLQYRGINVGAYDYFYTPHIDSNYVVAGQTGISMVFGTEATFSNNSIFLMGNNQTYGIFGGNPDTCWIYNNLIAAENAWYGIANAVDPAFNYNNFIIGNFSSGGIAAGNYNVIVNNVIINCPKGIVVPSGHNPVIKYNNSWNNTVNYSGFTPDSTNLSVDPMVVNTDTSQGELDFHLQMFSPLIDKGDPNILDKDGSRSDIGLYGGPFGEIYQYQDLPPRAPVNLTALLDTNYILLKWNKNTEADFSHYNLFRDTLENFTADSTTLVVSTTDSFYISLIPEGADNLYFKLTAVDSQNNESIPSEELHVFLTGTIKNEEFIINNYKLFQNYPNPFNPSTKIGYRLKERGYVKLYVYDIKGELVQTLVNQYQEEGYYEVEFNGKTEKTAASLASRLASGIYIYQIMIRNENNIPVFSDIKKMILLK